VGDTDSLFAQIQQLLTGIGYQSRSNRILCTLMAANIILPGRPEPPGRKAAGPGAYTAATRDAIAAHGGRLLSRGGAGLLATFDGPARAIRCAGTLRDHMARLGIQFRLGIHCGEVDIDDDNVSGIAADIAAQLAALARPGEILTSRTIKDLVAGSGISFTDRGTHQLPDIPDQWPVFAVAGPHAAP
jgi:class 3 adenylate cyclase